MSDSYKCQSLNRKYAKLPGRPKTKLKILILTYYANDTYGNEIRQLTWANKQKYANSHGYDIIDAGMVPEFVSKINDEKSKMHNYFFYKYLTMLEVFKGSLGNNKSYDYIFWADPDALFLNHSKRIEDIIDERYDVIVTTGPPSHPQWGLVVNTGAFIVKNSELGKLFLGDVVFMSQNHCGEFLVTYPAASEALNGWLQVCNADGAYWLSDAGMVQALLSFTEAEYKCFIKKTWMRAFNSEFPWYGEGDLAVHFPGRGINDKKKLLRAFLQFTNFKNGTLKKGYEQILKSDKCLTSDLAELDFIFDPHNPICTS